MERLRTAHARRDRARDADWLVCYFALGESRSHVAIGARDDAGVARVMEFTQFTELSGCSLFNEKLLFFFIFFVLLNFMLLINCYIEAFLFRNFF